MTKAINSRKRILVVSVMMSALDSYIKDSFGLLNTFVLYYKGQNIYDQVLSVLLLDSITIFSFWMPNNLIL